jgi:hypothetical protein
VLFFPEFDPADLIGTTGHETPEAAACGDIPATFVKVVRVERSEGRTRALVVIEVNEDPALAWEMNYIVSVDGKWYAIAGGGALGPGTDVSVSDRKARHQ